MPRTAAFSRPQSSGANGAPDPLYAALCDAVKAYRANTDAVTGFYAERGLLHRIVGAWLCDRGADLLGGDLLGRRLCSRGARHIFYFIIIF